MATLQDFEARKRERLKKQREQREKLRRIRLVFSAAVCLLVFILIISGISKCAKNSKKNVSAPDTSVHSSQTPVESIAPQQAVSGIPEPSVDNNDLLSVIAKSGQKKHVYLTFDDGPNEKITPQVLDILRRYNVKATFFMVGKNISQYPAMCTRVMQEGHLASPHAYTHDYSTVYANETSFMDEVDKTYNLICENSPYGTEPFKLFRFPGGSFNDSNYGSSKQEFKDSLAEEGFYYIDWNCMTGDAEAGVDKSADGLYNYFMNNKPDLNNLIILMHDEENKQTTVDMLERLIVTLLQDGWEFSRLDEIQFANPIDRNTEAPEDASSSSRSNDGTEGSNTSSSSTTTSSSTASDSQTQSDNSKDKSGSSSSTQSSTTSGSSNTMKNSGTSYSGSSGSASASGTQPHNADTASQSSTDSNQSHIKVIESE